MTYREDCYYDWLEAGKHDTLIDAAIFAETGAREVVKMPRPTENAIRLAYLPDGRPVVVGLRKNNRVQATPENPSMAIELHHGLDRGYLGAHAELSQKILNPALYTGSESWIWNQRLTAQLYVCVWGDPACNGLAATFWTAEYRRVWQANREMLADPRNWTNNQPREGNVRGAFYSCTLLDFLLAARTGAPLPPKNTDRRWY